MVAHWFQNSTYSDFSQKSKRRAGSPPERTLVNNSDPYIRKPHSQSNLLEKFALNYRLKITLDGCLDPIVIRNGDLSDAGDGEHLLATFWGNGGGFSRIRAKRIRQALGGTYGERWTGGVGSDEAILVFSPTDERSMRFFVAALRIHAKRRVHPELVARLGCFAKPRKGTSGGHFGQHKRLRLLFWTLTFPQRRDVKRRYQMEHAVRLSLEADLKETRLHSGECRMSCLSMTSWPRRTGGRHVDASRAWNRRSINTRGPSPKNHFQ